MCLSLYERPPDRTKHSIVSNKTQNLLVIIAILDIDAGLNHLLFGQVVSKKHTNIARTHRHEQEIEEKQMMRIYQFGYFGFENTRMVGCYICTTVVQYISTIPQNLDYFI